MKMLHLRTLENTEQNVSTDLDLIFFFLSGSKIIFMRIQLFPDYFHIDIITWLNIDQCIDTYMCVCVSVYICEIYIYIYIYIYVCMYFTHTHTHIYICIFIYMYAIKQVNM